MVTSIETQKRGVIFIDHGDLDELELGRWWGWVYAHGDGSYALYETDEHGQGLWYAYGEWPSNDDAIKALGNTANTQLHGTTQFAVWPDVRRAKRHIEKYCKEHHG